MDNALYYAIAPERAGGSMQLQNRVVWITGASGGIGEQLALQASQAGARLVLSARRQDELEHVRLTRGFLNNPQRYLRRL